MPRPSLTARHGSRRAPHGWEPPSRADYTSGVPHEVHTRSERSGTPCGRDGVSAVYPTEGVPRERLVLLLLLVAVPAERRSPTAALCSGQSASPPGSSCSTSSPGLARLLVRTRNASWLRPNGLRQAGPSSRRAQRVLACATGVGDGRFPAAGGRVSPSGPGTSGQSHPAARLHESAPCPPRESVETISRGKLFLMSTSGTPYNVNPRALRTLRAEVKIMAATPSGVPRPTAAATLYLSTRTASSSLTRRRSGLHAPAFETLKRPLTSPRRGPLAATHARVMPARPQAAVSEKSPAMVAHPCRLGYGEKPVRRLLGERGKKGIPEGWVQGGIPRKRRMRRRTGRRTSRRPAAVLDGHVADGRRPPRSRPRSRARPRRRRGWR